MVMEDDMMEDDMTVPMHVRRRDGMPVPRMEEPALPGSPTLARSRRGCVRLPGHPPISRVASRPRLPGTRGWAQPGPPRHRHAMQPPGPLRRRSLNVARSMPPSRITLSSLPSSSDRSRMARRTRGRSARWTRRTRPSRVGRMIARTRRRPGPSPEAGCRRGNHILTVSPVYLALRPRGGIRIYEVWVSSAPLLAPPHPLPVCPW